MLNLTPDQMRNDAAAPALPAFGESCARRRLTWWPEVGVGYYPVETGAEPYDQGYFDRFEQQAQSEIGKALMRARVEFVQRHHLYDVVDVGIGSGAFVTALRETGQYCFGYDVNPAGQDWLLTRGLFVDPYRASVEALTLWDVLEHIPDFERLIDRARKWVFVSIPIFTDGAHVLRSKHYRKDEHVWYFTDWGLMAAMESLGFECVETSNFETKIGREDIGSFAFRRVR